MNDVFKVSTFIYIFFLFFKYLWEKKAQMNIFPFINLYVFFIGQFNERVLQECQH
jgi:hypothetical protein